MVTLTRSAAWRLVIFMACIGPLIFAGQLVSLLASSPRQLQLTPILPDEFDRTLTRLAEANAIDCGHLSFGGCIPPVASDFRASDACVANAFRSKKAFKFRCGRSAWGAQSSLTSEGLVLTPQGAMYSLTFDSSHLPDSFPNKISKHLALYKFRHPVIKSAYGRQLMRERGSTKSPKRSSPKARRIELSKQSSRALPRKSLTPSSEKE